MTMCGIVGYIGGQQAAPLLLEGLTRLEHRGYDSAGVAVLGSSGLKVAKQAGRVRQLAEDLPKRFSGRSGIGHTRLQLHGVRNPEIYRTIAAELADRVVAAPELSERQLRRIIYG
jgi:glucosamine--fructose-6-phosphate aminotransferase (isomerizing)